MKRKNITVLLFLHLSIGCASGQINKIESTKRQQDTPSKKVENLQKENDRKSDLTGQIKQIAKTVGLGRVGVAATILETGETVSLNAKDRYPMQSVYKLPIGMTVLSQIDAGQLNLSERLRIEKENVLKTSRILPKEKFPDGTEQTIEELLRLMVSESDNTASDALLRLVGGPEAVMKFLNKNEIFGIEIANYEKEFAADWRVQYKNRAAPKAAIELLRALHESRGLSAQSQALLLKYMTDSPTGPRRLKGLLPEDAQVAHKTGTSGTRDGITAATNDIGIVTLPDGRHLAIAVFVSDSPADETIREETIARIARAVWDYWSKK